MQVIDHETDEFLSDPHIPDDVEDPTPFDDTLGFSDNAQPERPDYTWLFVNNTGQSLWHTLEPGQNGPQVVHIEQNALTGILVDVDIVEAQRQGRPVPKLYVTLRADETYVIVSGSDTVFSRFLLSGMVKSGADGSKPITIGVKEGKPPYSPVLASLTVDGELIFTKSEEEVPVEEAIATIRERLDV